MVTVVVVAVTVQALGLKQTPRLQESVGQACEVSLVQSPSVQEQSKDVLSSGAQGVTAQAAWIAQAVTVQAPQVALLLTVDAQAAVSAETQAAMSAHVDEAQEAVTAQHASIYAAASECFVSL